MSRTGIYPYTGLASSTTRNQTSMPPINSRYSNYNSRSPNYTSTYENRSRGISNDRFGAMGSGTSSQGLTSKGPLSVNRQLPSGSGPYNAAGGTLDRNRLPTKAEAYSTGSMRRTSSVNSLRTPYTSSITSSPSTRHTYHKPLPSSSSRDRLSSASRGNSTTTDLSEPFTNGSDSSPPSKASPLDAQIGSLAISTNSNNRGPTDREGLVGISNLGNTCFMNSVLQCLSNSRRLLKVCLSRSYEADINPKSKMKGNLFETYAALIRQLWEPGADTYINPTKFRSQIQKFAPRFMGNSQQDSQEFLRYLLEGLHEDVNRIKVRPKPIIPNYDEEDKIEDSEKANVYWNRYLRMDDSIIVDLFMGQLKSTLRCEKCGYSSTTFDPFWDLSLPIPKRSSSISIMDCFQLFTNKEVLDGDEKPMCSRCKVRQRCTKGFSIQRFPKILVLHLKRFSGERYRSKMGAHIDFPTENLNLTEFAAESADQPNVTYNLFAISNHVGSVHSGHYTANCKHHKSNLWYDYNDTRVSKVSERSVVSSEAYVLFYEMVS